VHAWLEVGVGDGCWVVGGGERGAGSLLDLEELRLLELLDGGSGGGGG